jgi:hypothetical protein
MFQQSPAEGICVIRPSAIGDSCHVLMADIPGVEFITLR